MEALKERGQTVNERSSREAKGQITAEEMDGIVLSKEEGVRRWKEEMTLRFLKGEDGEFDYEEVDNNEAYDDHRTIERDEEERWFDEEKPQWTELQQEVNDVQKRDILPHLVGQTGVQDF